MGKPKVVKEEKPLEVTSEEVETVENPEDIGAYIEVLPYRIYRADTNNIVLQKLKKRKTSDDTYWDTEGYYNNVVNAVLKLFYKDISAQHVESIKELGEIVKVSEQRIIKAISNIKI